MSLYKIPTLCLAIVMPFLASCVTESSAESPIPNINYSVIASGQYRIDGLYGNRKVEVFTDQTQFNATLYQYIQPIVEYTVDFTSKKVVFLSLDQRTNGGYLITAENVENHGEYIKIKVLIEEPGDNCVYTTAATSPYEFIEIESIKQIVFDERIEEVSC